MKITLLEAGNGVWLKFIAHLRDKNVEIRLWQSPWVLPLKGAPTTQPMEDADANIVDELKRAGIEIKCGGVVEEILTAVSHALDHPPAEWVVGGFYPQLGRRIPYHDGRGQFPSECYGYFFQPVAHWLAQGMTKEEVLSMFNI
jgi:hypothetical protein